MQYAHYPQLTAQEKAFVDAVFDKVDDVNRDGYYIPLCYDDRLERAVDALAEAVIASRSA